MNPEMVQAAIRHGGILFEQSLLSEPWFTVFATFVAINTLGYVAITVAKVLPLPKFARRSGRNRRAETRGIVPDDLTREIGDPADPRLRGAEWPHEH